MSDLRGYVLFICVCLCLLMTVPVMGWGVDEDRIPNGGVFSCDTCHGATTHTLNSFGIAYENAGDNWTVALAQADSDNDGYTNGEELLDPDGSWSMGQPNPGSSTDVTNPGSASSHPTDPTATPAATATPGPTQTPAATATPGATATPADCLQTGVQILMPAENFAPGDSFYCHVNVCNSEGQTLTGNPLLVLLDVFGLYYFAPTFGSDLSYYSQDYLPGTTTVEVLPEFSWPTGAGTAQGIVWYAALTNPSISELIGEMDMKTFGWMD